MEHTGVHMSGLHDKIKAWFSDSSSSNTGTDQLDHNGTCEVARNVQAAAEAAGVDAKTKYEESKMMNITCLQYPDSGRSYFKVYSSAKGLVQLQPKLQGEDILPWHDRGLLLPHIQAS